MSRADLPYDQWPPLAPALRTLQVGDLVMVRPEAAHERAGQTGTVGERPRAIRKPRMSLSEPWSETEGHYASSVPAELLLPGGLV